MIKPSDNYGTKCSPALTNKSIATYSVPTEMNKMMLQMLKLVTKQSIELKQ